MALSLLSELLHTGVVTTSLVSFHLLRMLFEKIQHVKWFCDGTLKAKKTGIDPRNYTSSAQVLSIWMKLPYEPILCGNTTQSFILQHQAFVNPSYVLQEHVSLYQVTRKEAIFVEASLGVEVWKRKYGSWHRQAQNDHAEKIIKMPLSSFHRLAEELGEIEEKLIFLEYIPRSGSTLFCNICVSFKEPHILNDWWRRDTMEERDPERAEKVYKSAIRLLCKPRKAATQAFLFKICAVEFTKNLIILSKIFPQASIFMLYRNGAPLAWSCTRITMAFGWMKDYLHPFRHLFPYLWRRGMLKYYTHVCFSIPPDVEKFLLNCDHKQFPYMWGFVGWAGFLSVQRRLQASLGDAASKFVKYEDLCDNPRKSIHDIFVHCGLSPELVPQAMKAIDYDSQFGSSYSREKLAGQLLDEFIHDEQIQERMADVCRWFGIDSLQGDIRLPDTITTSA